MSWTESDHARLVALKQQRALLSRTEDGTRIPDEQLDKNKIRKLTIEIKEINKRLVAYQRGLEQGTVSEEEPAVEEPAVEEPAVEEPADSDLPEGVLEAYNAWKDKTGKWTDFVKACGGVKNAKEYRAVIESN